MICDILKVKVDLVCLGGPFRSVSCFPSIRTDPLWQKYGPNFHQNTDPQAKKYRPFEPYIFQIGLRWFR